MYNGYEFYFAVKNIEDSESLSTSDVIMTLPITPSEVKYKVGSNNKVINLVNDGEINILKSPSLADIEFDARFPMRKYPFSREVKPFQFYYKKFKNLKVKKKAFRLIIARSTPNGKRTWDTNELVTLEEFEINESAEDGDDVIVSFTLKQYKSYDVVKLDSSTLPTKKRDTDGKGETTQRYIVKDGDTLQTISKKFYGTTAYWKTIYEYNRSAIEEDAKRHGLHSSVNGKYIWEGLDLIIPPKPTSTPKSSGGSAESSESVSTVEETVPTTGTVTNGTYRLEVTLNQPPLDENGKQYTVSADIVYYNNGKK